MVGYLDSSVVLRHVLLGESAIRHALALPRVIACELIEVECRRVIHRYRLSGDLDDEGFVEALGRLERVLAGMSLLSLSRTVMRRAMGAFPVTVRTLDAIHLSAAMVFAEAEPGESVTVFSHDAGMNRCARSLGFSAPLTEPAPPTTG